MRFLSIIVVCFFSLEISAQINSGNYCVGDLKEQGFHSCLEFWNNHTFWYSDQCADCGWLQGVGEYELLHDTLQLHFKTTCRIEKTNLPVRESVDSIFYCIQIETHDSLKLPFVFVEVTDKNNKHNPIRADSSHCYRFGIRKEEAAQLFLKVYGFDFNEEWISLATLPSSATVYLTKGDNNIPSYETFVYKVDFIGKNRLTLTAISGINGEIRSADRTKTTYYK